MKGTLFSSGFCCGMNANLTADQETIVQLPSYRSVLEKDSQLWIAHRDCAISVCEKKLVHTDGLFK